MTLFSWLPENPVSLKYSSAMMPSSRRKYDGAWKPDVEFGSAKAKRSGKKASSGDKFQAPEDVSVADATASFDSVCSHCGEAIPKGSECQWVPTGGLYHNECIEIPSS